MMILCAYESFAYLSRRQVLPTPGDVSWCVVCVRTRTHAWVCRIRELMPGHGSVFEYLRVCEGVWVWVYACADVCVCVRV